ncbi:MAG: cobalamin-binding protein [Halioglobus sp.]|nr:cobalamin-binding protein [Halioglobus sp.]|tara:strand:+ start:1596 stop:2501 length:906 start_codon:yes stop_codon:yes gene_type:complete
MRCVYIVLLLLVAPLVSAEIRVRDALGRELVLEQPARRVISLAPHITEVVFAAGAAEQLVGTVSYSDYPPAARDVPRVGTYDTINFESILALQPDLVLAWRSGSSEEAIARLQALGIKVFVQEPRALEDVATALRDVGTLTGNSAAGELRAQRFLRDLQRLRQSYSTLPPVSVYYQIWNEPLLTLNDEHIISDVIRLCGGRNVFGGAIPLVSRISVEAVIRADPDVIVASGMDEARPEWLDQWRQWHSMRAVANNQLYFVPPDILQRHTPRLIQGASRLCAHLDSARRFYAREVGKATPRP